MSETRDDWWRREGLTLNDVIRHKADFLANPGREIDWESIADELGFNDDFEYAPLASQWFDELVGKFQGQATFTLHRHMTVADFGGYVDGLESGTGTVGAHWSMSEDTSSPYPYQSWIDVLLTGEVRADQVDWFTTFQNFFAFPEEREISFHGPIRLLSILNMRTGQTHEPQKDSYETIREDEPAFAP